MSVTSKLEPWDDAARARKVRRSWFWAGFCDGLAFGRLWRWLARHMPEPSQCCALSRRKNYCQKAARHCDAHISALGEEWR